MIDYAGDIAYADSRLSDSVVRSEDRDELVYVYRVRGDGVNIYYLSDRTEATVPLESLDLVPFPMGYTVCPGNGGRVTYLSRIPARRFRQGLTQQTLWSSFGRVHFNTKVVNDAYKQPKLNQELLGDMLSNGELIPFVLTRDVAMLPNGNKFALQYVGRKVVGSVTFKDKLKVEIDNSYVFLKESLEEAFANLKL